MPWPALEARLQTDLGKALAAGEGRNTTIIGPKGSGKTHIGLTVAELCPYVLVLATKRQDPLVEELQRKGYHVTGDLEQLQWADSDRSSKPVPVSSKVVYWPRASDKFTPKMRIEFQRLRMEKAIDWAEKTGGWAVVIDETMWMNDRLRLGDELDSLWYQGRTAGLSLIANGQRPSHMPRLAFSQLDYLFIAKFSDKRDIETLREISSNIPKEYVDAGIAGLDKDAHEFLFMDVARNHLAVVVAPPR